MRILLAIVSAAVLLAAAPAPQNVSLDGKLRGILQSYLNERGKIEHITVASLSARLGPTGQNVQVAVGTTPSNLFQIGSNTKAFTAVIMLQLEAANRLNIDEPVGRFLRQYPAWRNVPIRRLLDMTGGLPTYDNDPAFQRTYAAHPFRYYSASELVKAVYPKSGNAKFIPGWSYSNTGYILAQMVIERLTGEPFAEVLQQRIFQPFGLRDMYYDPHGFSPSVLARTVPGYFASNDPDNKGLAPLFGRNVRDCSLSWTQAAGGIVATPAEVTRWASFLYAGARLPTRQRVELASLVSTKTGDPISMTTPSDPRAFGLGISQMLKPPLGRFWFYEGETLGYRVIHLWLPHSGTIVTIGLNSQPNAKDDRIGELMAQVVAALPKDAQ